MRRGSRTSAIGEMTVSRNSNPDGSHVMTIGESGSDDGQFNRPTGVTVDRDGDIYVADWANHRVQMFNSSGLFVRKVHRRRHVVGPGTRLHDHEHDGDEIARDDGDRTAKTLSDGLCR